MKETNKHNYQNMFMKIHRLKTVVITLHNNPTFTLKCLLELQIDDNMKRGLHH